MNSADFFGKRNWQIAASHLTSFAAMRVIAQTEGLRIATCRRRIVNAAGRAIGDDAP
jgi:hypothetical protein